MHSSVSDEFFTWSTQFEGLLTYMYLDVKGLVTIGLGNLIDSVGAAMALDYVHLDGTPATPGDVLTAWHAVKLRQDMRLLGGGHFAGITTIRATPESIQRLVNAKLAMFEASLRIVFPCWDTWPADAQLGTLSMTWAMGPGFTRNYPHFVTACRVCDWLLASQECRMDEMNQNESFKHRNKANVALFEAAAMTQTPELLTDPRCSEQSM